MQKGYIILTLFEVLHIDSELVSKLNRLPLHKAYLQMGRHSDPMAENSEVLSQDY